MAAMSKRARRGKKKSRIQPLTTEEMEQLEQHFSHADAVMPLVQAHGLITAMGSTPSPALGPSAWLPEVLGPRAEDEELSQLVLRLYNVVVSELNSGEVSIPLEADDETLGMWCQGYTAGVALDEVWQKDQVARMLVRPMEQLASPDDDRDHAAGSRQRLPEAVVALHEHWNNWRQQNLVTSSVSTPVKPPAARERKVGRNEKCPCGSGKKYKKCCGIK